MDRDFSFEEIDPDIEPDIEFDKINDDNIYILLFLIETVNIK